MKMQTVTMFIKNMTPPRRGMDWNMLDTRVTGRTYHQNQRTCLMRECKDFPFRLVHELTLNSGFSPKDDSKRPSHSTSSRQFISRWLKSSPCSKPAKT